MYKCDDCKHMVFDEQWGEYKCKKKLIRIYKPEEQENCKDYTKSTIANKEEEKK